MAQLTIEQAFQIAVQHHQAGRLTSAEALCRNILDQQPDHAGALHLLGVIAHQVGRHDMAMELIGRAVALNPNFLEAWNNLGIVLRDKGQLDAAIAAFRQAIALNSNSYEAYSNLGSALRDKGQFDAAIVAYHQAIALNPNSPEAHSNLGNALRDKGQLDEAIAAYHQAINIDPNYPDAHNNLGVILRDQREFDEAITSCRRAISLKPGNIDAHINLGNALRDKGQIDEAIATYHQAIALKPNSPEAYSNLSNALSNKGQLDDAITACRHAITLNPNYPEAHLNLVLTLLTQGNLSQGWIEYEWRWKCKDYQRNFLQPQWDGRHQAGTTLLLHAEQGFGDTLHMMRYIPLVAQHGGTIIIECQAELIPLVQPLAAGCQIVTQGESLPKFDVHCPLMSLPRICGTTLENIPRQVPYVYADVEMTEKWRKMLAGDTNSLKVGLAWAGSKKYKNDRNRSMALSALAPLAQVDGVSFYSLQKREQKDEVRDPPVGLDLIDWTEDREDFADTAALIANLDLVISVETSVVQLSGAMGKPVWVLLSNAPDWRWLREREDSPWYPTMRLFRQTKPGDWEDVVRRVTEALTERLSLCSKQDR